MVTLFRHVGFRIGQYAIWPKAGGDAVGPALVRGAFSVVEIVLSSGIFFLVAKILCESQPDVGPQTRQGLAPLGQWTCVLHRLSEAQIEYANQTIRLLLS